ncbi:MAG: molybdopterin cofactor-binding domain-containing protein, partial [Myxococcota bacterium]
PGLRFATAQASPVFGGRVASVDDAVARAVPGVLDVLAFDTFVAVVAEHSWAARRGLDALIVRWEEGPGRSVSTESLRQARMEALSPDAPAKRVEGGTRLDAAEDGVVGGVYEVPYLEHHTMSPLNATAHVTDDRCTVWIPTQAQTLVQRAARRLTGLPEHAIAVHTTLLGGGFGRRGYTDEVEQVVQIAMRLGAPVQLQWSREETLRQGRYRPASAARMLGRLGADGSVEVVHARVARQSEFDFFVPDFAEGWRFAARMMSEGLTPMPYAFGSYRLDVARLESPVPVGFWRSVGHSANAFFVESFVDELAYAASIDPVAFRERLLEAHPRHLGVLRKAVAEAGPAPRGRFHGVAVHEAYDSLCAQVVEVSMEGGWPRVHRVVCALDCGEVIHPDGARAQVMGATLFGLSAALYGRVDIADGRVVQGNFHDAPLLRMHEAPSVEVHFVPSGAPVTGVGELGTPPVAPALCNALFAATGQRIRRLPLSDTLERT